MHSRVVLPAVLLITLTATTAPPKASVRLPSPPVRAVTAAFIDVAVIPMDTERTVPGQTVLVRDGRIAAMGPTGKVDVPGDAVRIDGRGKFLIPGLGDMHTHVHVHSPRAPDADSLLMEQMLFLYLANGVTTIRNMQDIDMSWRKRAANGTLASPHIYSSGHKLFDVAFRTTGNDSVVNILSPSDAAEAIAREKAAGYDFLKMYQLGEETFDSVVAAANRVGIRFAGHVPEGIPLERALAARYMSIEHLTGYLSTNTNDAANLAALVEATNRAGVWNTPTYTVMQNFSIPSEELEQRPEMRYIDDQRIAQWSSGRMGMMASDDAMMQPARNVLKAMREGGAKLLLATDSPDNYGVPGFSIHRELAAMVSIGFTPYQALETGTRNVAEFFGTLDSTGTVAAGKRADLVLLNGNPLTDIRHTNQPAGVMVAGRWLDRAELDRRLASLEKAIY